MSIKNLLVDNDYDLYVNTLRVKDQIIVDNLAVDNLSVNDSAEIVNDLEVGNDLSVGNQILVGNGIYFDAALPAQLMQAYNVIKYNMGNGDGISSNPFRLSYIKIGNLVTVTFQASGSSFAVATGGTATITLPFTSMSTVGTALTADFAKLAGGGQGLEYYCTVNDLTANERRVGFVTYASTSINIRYMTAAGLINVNFPANSQIFNFAISYIVDY